MKVLFIGDAVGKPGRQAVRNYLERHRGKWDLVVLNGENLAGGQRNVFEAHNAFLNSPGHRDVMLDSRFRHLGTAVHITTQGYLYYYGQNFYTP